MNARKFYLILSSIIMFFLFITGIGILSSLNTVNVSGEESSLLDQIVEPLKNDREPFNVLLLGGDKVAKNTDTIMLVNFNPSTNKISILSIPRDTKVKVKSHTAKINSAYPSGGGKLAVETVSSLLDVSIKYYVYIDTSVFRKTIDLLGGVDFEVPVDMNYDDPLQNLHIHLKKGYQHLNGSQAEQFMRFRQPIHYNKEIMKYYDGSDLKRIDAQQNFIKAVIRQKANVMNLAKVKSIISVVFDNLDTNIKLSEAVKLSNYITKISHDQISMFKLPGEPQEGGAWYYLHDKSAAGKIIDEYFNSNLGFVPNTNSKEKKKTDDDKDSDEVSKPAPTKKPVSKPTPTPQNPSNDETSMSGTNTPDP